MWNYKLTLKFRAKIKEKFVIYDIAADINSNEWQKKSIEQTWQFRNGTGLLKEVQTEESAFGFETTDKQAQKGVCHFSQRRDNSDNDKTLSC